MTNINLKKANKHERKIAVFVTNTKQDERLHRMADGNGPGEHPEVAGLIGALTACERRANWSEYTKDS